LETRPNWTRLRPVGRQAATGWLHAFDITDADRPIRYVGTGHGRGAMVVAHSGIWVANSRSKSVVRVDPEALEVTAAQSFEKAPIAIAIAADADSVWALTSDGWVWRLWPSGETEGVTRLDRGAVAIEAAGGLVWILHRGGRLAGVEPANGETVAECRLPRPAMCMTGGDDGLWVACGGGRRLARVDLHGAVAAVQIELPQRATCLAPAGDRLLAGCRRILARWGSLLEIDRVEPRVVATTALQAAPRALAVQDPSTAWIACGRGRVREGTIEQVDLPSGAVTERWTTDWPVSDLALFDGTLLAAMSISVGGYIDDGDAIGFADGG
jgi:hypothetical protein